MMMSSFQAENESASVTVTVGGVELRLTPRPGLSSNGRSLSISTMSNGEVSIDLNGFVGLLELRAKNHNVDDNHNLPNANVDIAATASLHSILGFDGISTPPTDDITAPSTPIERSQTETDIETYLLDLIRDYFTASGGIANVRNLGKHLKACRGFHKASKSALLELKENFDSLTKFLKIHEDIFSVQEEKGKGSCQPFPCRHGHTPGLRKKYQS